MAHVLILGGDGFCGWPTALHLSARGHDVSIIDDMSRRDIDRELGTNSLTPILSLGERVTAWHDLTGKKIRYYVARVGANSHSLADFVDDKVPDAIVHFAEQRSAPYSMRGPREKHYTVTRNNAATNAVCSAIVDSMRDIHLVHLGTMGVYGYGTAGRAIPEGYMDVGGEWVLHPMNPGSIYHLTKCHDQLTFQFYNRNDGLRITDLHQGIVWGTQTPETFMDPRLINRFDYDGDYGTVLNRFLMQGVLGYPLTVHGTGGQTRAFIHISDTVKCIEMAIDNPPEHGMPVRIFNQMTETHRVRDLADMVHKLTGTPVEFVHNPRNEAAENDLVVHNSGLIGMGLEPKTLSVSLMGEIIDIADKFKDRADRSKIACTSYWNDDRAFPSRQIRRPLRDKVTT